jgi:MoaA/NifB/PqqE/SkfB family radical SAM enzyme
MVYKRNGKELVYSSFKVAHHQDKIKQIRKKKLITPTMVQWDITNRCNLSCSFCFYHIYPLTDWDIKTEMPYDTIASILSELYLIGIRTVEWTGGGEPTLHKNWELITTLATSLGFEQALVTNGTLIDKCINLIRNFEWVRVSVDAATKETYAKVKGFDRFDTVINNIKQLVKERNQGNVIGFSFIVCQENYQEIMDAAELAKSLGCDNIRFSLAMTPEHDKLFDGIWAECVNQLDEARKLEDSNFKVFSFSNRINEIAHKSHSSHCHYCQFVGVISPTGIYPCCRLKDDNLFNFGTLEKTSFSEIWNSTKRKTFIRMVAEKGCGYDCWMTEKNNFIHYLTQTNPRHVNFI